MAASCNDVQIFIAVGHGETYPGTQRSITSIVCGGRTKCGTTNIDYPSTASGDYCGSVETGIKNGIDSVTAYVTNCPSAKIVLTGWSQGGQVASDIISGGGGVGQGPIAKCTQKTSSGLSPTTAPGKNGENLPDLEMYSMSLMIPESCCCNTLWGPASHGWAIIQCGNRCCKKWSESFLADNLLLYFVWTKLFTVLAT